MKVKLSRIKPSIILGIFLIFSIAITIFLIQKGVLTITRARPSADPQNVKITNVNDTSFTVVFTTSLKTSAAIKILDQNKSGIVLDDRDKENSLQNEYYSHHITISNLNPKSTYSFSIISNGQEFSSPGQYLITTGSDVKSEPAAKAPIQGTAVLPDGSKASDTIVTVKTEDSQLISGITDSEGKYSISLTTLRTESLNEYASLDPSSQLFINFYREQYAAKITANYLLGQSLPNITLNQTYTFTPNNSSLSNNPQESFDSIEPAAQNSREPSVTTPKEGQSFVDSKPSFSGTGGSDRKTTIIISSLGISETIEISSNGNWSFRPLSDLAPGNYSADFDIQDDNGITKRISRSFSVLASGSRVSESATPSATPTFSPTPTVTQSPSLSPSPSISQSPTVSPSQTPTPTAELILTPTTAQITPTTAPFIPTSTPLEPIEDSGDATSTAIFGALSIVLIVAGAVIFFAL